ncbi:MAG: hypothetical protein GY853_01945 [PVC group bacterium]|nr:hypothetical protein [PVC group bacterium]
MSDYHVLNRPKQDRLNVVFHFAVPDSNNSAGVSIRNIIRDNFVVAENLLDPEDTDVLNGITLELKRMVYFSADSTTQEIVAAIVAKRADVLEQATKVINEQYSYFGYSADIS